MTSHSTVGDQAHGTITLRVPLRLRRRGGRKLVITPSTVMLETPPPRQEDALIKAIARAHRWSRLLETGQFESIAALAAAEKIDKSYLSKILRLTLLAPDIVETILDTRQSRLQIDRILQRIPVDWPSQRNVIAEAETRSVPPA